MFFDHCAHERYLEMSLIFCQIFLFKQESVKCIKNGKIFAKYMQRFYCLFVLIILFIFCPRSMCFTHLSIVYILPSSYVSYPLIYCLDIALVLCAIPIYLLPCFHPMLLHYSFSLLNSIIALRHI